MNLRTLVSLRLREPSELVTQLETAGFTGVTARSLIPGESFYAFVGAGLR